MITGFEPLLKWTPIAGAIIAAAIAYGQLSTDIKNLQFNQQQQFQLIQNQLSAIHTTLENSK